MSGNIYNILKGTFLVSDDSFRNWKFIIFISVLAIVMIASSHSVDRKVYKIAHLTNEVKEMRSAFVDSRSRLMRLKMESSILQRMKAKDLVSSETPPRKIRVKSNK